MLSNRFSTTVLKSGYPLRNIAKTARAPRASSSRTVTIVGAGRVGRTLGRLLGETGYQIDTVISRSRAKAAAARKFTGARFAGTRINEEAFRRSAIVLITTTDSVIRETADQAARLQTEWKKKIVFHTSGAFTSVELSALRRRGAQVGSLHPLQTFSQPRAAVRNLDGVFYSFEGTRSAERVARRMVRALKGRFFKLPPQHKTLYHCAGFFACGGLLAALSAAYTLYKVIGIEEPRARAMLAPLVAATIEGAEKNKLAQTITGPISRADHMTVKRHLMELSRSAPALQPLYCSLSLQILRLSSKKLPAPKARLLEELLKNSSANSKSK